MSAFQQVSDFNKAVRPAKAAVARATELMPRKLLREGLIKGLRSSGHLNVHLRSDKDSTSERPTLPTIWELPEKHETSRRFTSD
jgi:hypothetical protein